VFVLSDLVEWLYLYCQTWCSDCVWNHIWYETSDGVHLHQKYNWHQFTLQGSLWKLFDFIQLCYTLNAHNVKLNNIILCSKFVKLLVIEWQIICKQCRMNQIGCFIVAIRTVFQQVGHLTESINTSRGLPVWWLLTESINTTAVNALDTLYV